MTVSLYALPLCAGRSIRFRLLVCSTLCAIMSAAQVAGCLGVQCTCAML